MSRIGQPRKGFNVMAYNRQKSERQQKDWDTSSIDAMERTARSEADHDCSLKIRGQWLEVAYIEASDTFTYKWGKNMVPRHVAETVHATR